MAGEFFSKEFVTVLDGSHYADGIFRAKLRDDAFDRVQLHLDGTLYAGDGITAPIPVGGGGPAGAASAFISGWGGAPDSLSPTSPELMARAIPIAVGGAIVAGSLGIVMPRAGSIIGISAIQTVPNGVGETVSYRPRINGVAQVFPVVLISGALSASGYGTIPAGVTEFEAGDIVTIEMELSLGSGSAATLASASIEIQFNE